MYVSVCARVWWERLRFTVLANLVFSAVLVTLVTRLHVERSSASLHLKTRSLWALTRFRPLPPPSDPRNHRWTLCFGQLIFLCTISPLRETVQCRSFLAWLPSLITMPSSFIHVVTKAGFPSFLRLSIGSILYTVYVISQDHRRRRRKSPEKRETDHFKKL